MKSLKITLFKIFLNILYIKKQHLLGGIYNGKSSY
nr:MAG TPA: hypothetical protein [Caudoviricetes sp.]